MKNNADKEMIIFWNDVRPQVIKSESDFTVIAMNGSMPFSSFTGNAYIKPNEIAKRSAFIRKPNMSIGNNRIELSYNCADFPDGNA